MTDENLPPAQLLLVEGDSDLSVSLHLWRRAHGGDDPPFRIEPAGGVGKLLERIEAEIDAPGRTHVGFVVDADDDPHQRWDEMKGRLQLVGVTLGDQSPSGVRVEGRMPKAIGVWMMPDNQRTGELENFLREMIPEADSLWPLAETYVAEVKKTDQRFATNKQLRAEIHSWLAVQDRPGLAGPAIETDLLSVDGDLARRYVQWMERMFIST